MQMRRLKYLPKVEQYLDHTPVLVDDIISTGQTMIETIRHLNNFGMKAPVCIGVHAVFAGNAYQDILLENVERIVTCNTMKAIRSISVIYLLPVILHYNFTKFRPSS